MTHDVAIVGAGIGGSVLALDLARRGWNVAIVERETSAPRHIRPEILWGATPAALDRLGIGAAIRRDASVRLDGIDFGGRLVFSERDLHAARVEAFSTDPSATRQLVVDAALATGRVEIRRGIEIDALRRVEGAVVGISGKRGAERFDLEARLVVGDDGAHSVVRSQLGIGIEFGMFPFDFVTAPIRWPSSMPPTKGRVFLDTRSMHAGIPAVAFVPWPKGAGVLMIPLPHERAESLWSAGPEDFWRDLERTTPLAASLREELVFPRDFARVRRPFGHASRYVADGAAILGDAAHPMSPAGGQGANAAIFDALALAEVADAALRSSSSPRPLRPLRPLRSVSREALAGYEERRHPVNEQSVAFSRTGSRVIRLGRRLPVTILFPLLLRTANLLVWPKRKLLRTVSTAFVGS